MGDRHYTPPGVADYMAALVGHAGVVVDPHCGDGALLRAYLKRYPRTDIIGGDVDEQAVRGCIGWAQRAWPSMEMCDIHVRDVLDTLAVAQQYAGVLSVMMNPPYESDCGAARTAEVLRWAADIAGRRKHSVVVVGLLPLDLLAGKQRYRKLWGEPWGQPESVHVLPGRVSHVGPDSQARGAGKRPQAIYVWEYGAHVRQPVPLLRWVDPDEVSP